MNFPITSSSDASDIEQLQQALIDRGFGIAVDGVLGPKTTAAIKAFQAANALTADGDVGLATWGKLTASAPPATSTPTPPATSTPAPPATSTHAPSAPAPPATSTPAGHSTPSVTPTPAAGAGPFAGFDTQGYPGDAAMKTWKESSPYSFVGYYLKSPCHADDGWMGKRATIECMGWDIVLIYVGRQSQGPCSEVPPDRAKGLADAQDALAKTASEGFTPQTIIYLDVEPMDHIPQAQIEYINGWLSQFSGALFLPGIYCHVKNANALKGAITDFPSEQVAFWVSGSGHLVAGTSRPANSGIAFARIWQGTFDETKTFGGVSIQIDENVADTRANTLSGNASSSFRAGGFTSTE
ncbi:MAG TPA: glycoside hydrolase domain-containing protein [Candidatus Acidoferrales bacterium]|jgi:hypothetical protein|nr:glycoside hydrolase domain-containing protein [Candidatus Acidoferrales bacterium]